MAVSVQITVTVPDNVINDAKVRAEIEKALRTRTAPELRRKFAKTVDGWGHKPDFSQKFANRSGYVSATVYASGPNADQYAIVNYGSRPHTITPKRGGMLRFQPGYSAATRPRVIGSRAKRRSGSPIGAFSVKHPGFEAREFDIAIAEEIADSFEKDVQDAIIRGASSL